MTTNTLSVSNGAVLSAATRNAFNGGNIFVNVNTFEAIDSGQLLTTAFSSGRAGNITVDASNKVTLSGSDRNYFEWAAQFGEDVVGGIGPTSGLFANTFKTSTGQGEI